MALGGVEVARRERRSIHAMARGGVEVTRGGRRSSRAKGEEKNRALSGGRVGGGASLHGGDNMNLGFLWHG